VTALAVAALLVPTAAFAQDADPALEALGSATTDASTLPQTISFRYVAGVIVIDVDLDGSGRTVPLMVDTGAPTNLSDDLVDELAIGAAGAIFENAIDGSEFPQGVVVIPTVSIGGARFEDVGAVKGFLEPGDPFSCIVDGGIIGASLMKDAVWQIDYRAQELTIAPSIDGLDHVSDTTAVEFTVDFQESPSPVVNVLADDGILIFILDTGSDGSIAVSPQDMAVVGIEVREGAPAFTAAAMGAAGTFKTRLEYANVDLSFVGGVLEDYPLAGEETLELGSGNIGNRFLEDFVVTFDWPGRRIYLDPVATVPAPPVPASASLGWDGEQFAIAAVTDGTALADAGISLGDVVVAADGQDVTGSSLDDYCPFFRREGPAEFGITLSDGQAFKIGPVEDFFDPSDG
jgi:predicted aspartyl protease